jgi:hypothetical protein
MWPLAQIDGRYFACLGVNAFTRVDELGLEAIG